MNRRDFLSSVATLPALAVIQPGQAAQAPRPGPVRSGLELGTVTYNIAKDWDIPTML